METTDLFAADQPENEGERMTFSTRLWNFVEAESPRRRLRSIRNRDCLRKQKLHQPSFELARWP